MGRAGPGRAQHYEAYAIPFDEIYTSPVGGPHNYEIGGGGGVHGGGWEPILYYYTPNFRHIYHPVLMHRDLRCTKSCCFPQLSMRRLIVLC